LGLVGYESPEKENPSGSFEDQGQPYGVLLTLRLLVCICPIFFLLLAVVVVYFYPVSRDSAAVVVAQKNRVDLDGLDDKIFASGPVDEELASIRSYSSVKTSSSSR
jgi:hypothetical protein